MKEEIKDLRNENDEIKHSLQFTQDQLKDALSELVTQKKLNQACSEAQSKTGKLLERVRILEDNSKKNNVVINGIPAMKDENGERLHVHVCKLLSDTLVINVETESVQRLGREEAGRSRPILVKFRNEADKLSCLKAAPKLKGSNIYILMRTFPVQHWT